MIRRNNQRLIGTVYADIMEDLWAVSLGYNMVRNPGLHGKENSFEVRYSFQPEVGESVLRVGTDTGVEETIAKQTFKNPDEFITWALGEEKKIQLSPA